jgi:protein-disulfide isomerase
MFLKTLGAAIAALALAAACGPKALTPVEGDSFLGPADSKVVVIEYGAPTCPGCKAWHDGNWARLKAAYVDTNKIKFIFREFPSHNPPVDAAIFSLARCAGTADWFPLIDEAFARQKDIEIASQGGTATDALKSLGQKFRLSAAQVESCIKDPKNIQRIYDVQEEGFGRGVHSTPTFFLNDKEVIDPRFETLSKEIDAALGLAPAPAAPVPTEEAPAPTETPAPAAPAPATPAPATPAPAKPAQQ